MATDVMLQLGDYQFTINTAAYQELRRSTEYRWPSQDRVGQSAALQYTGPGADSITLTGVVFPTWRGGIGQPDAMRAEADKGKPLLMVDGQGFVHGNWVIERIEEQQGTFFSDGVPRRQGFTLQLRRYDDVS